MLAAYLEVVAELQKRNLCLDTRQPGRSLLWTILWAAAVKIVGAKVFPTTLLLGRNLVFCASARTGNADADGRRRHCSPVVGRPSGQTVPCVIFRRPGDRRRRDRRAPMLSSVAGTPNIDIAEVIQHSANIGLGAFVLRSPLGEQIAHRVSAAYRMHSSSDGDRSLASVFPGLTSRGL